jgi:S-ribosylhomocysteine lyase
MVNVEQLGWDPATVGELDHRLLQAPHIKLRSFVEGQNGDVVYCIDLRLNRPNTIYLSSTELHSFEHFLLAGFRRYLPENFMSVGIMGCQTGFYLVLLNEGNAARIRGVFESILKDVLQAREVPYASIQECGNYRNHSLELAQKLAGRVLDAESNWLQVV